MQLVDHESQPLLLWVEGLASQTILSRLLVIVQEQSFTVTVCESQSIDQDHHTKLRDRLVCIVQCVNNVSVNKSRKCPVLEARLTGMQLNVVST